MTYSRFFHLLFAILILAAPLQALAQEELPPPSSPDRAALLEASALVTDEAYPDADAVVLYDHTEVIYQETGAYTHWNESWIKVLTEEARRNFSSLSSYYTIPYQRGPEDCRIDLVEIINGAGESRLIEVEKQSRTMINPGSMGQNIYNPNDKIIQVNIPGLQIGDVLHYRLYDRIVQPRMTNTWCDWFVLEDTMPILLKSLAIHAPLSLPLRATALKAPASGTVEASAETNQTEIVCQWTARNVPQFFPEPNMPAAYTVLQRLLVSTVPDWETISRWYWNLSEPHFEITPAIREKVRELTEGIDEPQRRIEALFRFVAQQIRYMGITIEATSPGYEPHDVKDTFDARHGVCRDKAALLVAMLREAGFDAFPTLIHNGPKKDAEVPQPYFNHAIVAVLNSDGDYQLMDPTDESTAELLPAYLNDRSYLVATPEGETLRTSPIIPAEENLMRIRTTARLTPDGRLTASTDLQFDGINDNAYRSYFASLKPIERTRYLEGILKRAVPDCVVDELLIQPEDMMDSATPLSATLRYQAQNMLIQGKETAMLPIPRIGLSLGLANFIIGKTGLRERKYPLLTEIACGVDEKILIELPDELGSPLAIPEYDAVQNEGTTWNITCAVTGQTLAAASRFTLNLTEYAPEQYLALKKTLKTIERDLRKKPLFAMPPDQAVEPASRILAADVRYTVHSANAWEETRTIRREILTYAGKKNNAELKLAYNPAWETVTLRHARVIAPDGSEKPIRDEEINRMDAPWVGAAPRYPAGKILVAAFPGVEIGSILEFELTRTCSNRPFFSTLEFFRLPDPIQEKTVSLTLPETLTQHLYPQLADTILASDRLDEQGRLHTYEWSVRDVPAVREEDHMPPWFAFNPSLFFSTGDWTEYAALVHAALQRAATGQPAAESKARELIVGIENPEEQIRILRDFIATRIRPVGPALNELPLSAITPADQTLADAYGNQTDTAVLFHAMLTAVGFRPDFLLASGTPFIEELVRPYAVAPAADLFGSVLVRVKLPDARTWYLNDGNQYSALGASTYEEMIALDLADAAFGKITPEQPTTDERSYTLRIESNQTVRIAILDTLLGNRFGIENQRYSEMQPEDRRRHHQELTAQVSQAALPDGELLTDFSTYPGKIAYAVLIPDYAITAGPWLYFDLPETLGRLFRLRDDTRTNPLYLAAPQRRNLRTLIELPHAYTVESAPENFTRNGIANAPVSISIQADTVTSQQQKTLVIDARLEAEPALIEPTHYDELLRLEGRLESPRNDTLILRATDPVD
ncbi:MAG: DUF3857 domain-containing protein [Kiritimatiellae bacterium]|nr:DUF3857 domain-containing protein [Kiritimatiellia bacterium]